MRRRLAAKLKLPIFVVQGERDYQVSGGSTSPRWQKALGEEDDESSSSIRS